MYPLLMGTFPCRMSRIFSFDLIGLNEACCFVGARRCEKPLGCAVFQRGKRMKDQFHEQLISLLPPMRIQAMALTRNRAAADDLVQDAVANALAARDSFTPGTNMGAWLHRILRNRFISNMRKRRETADISDVAPHLLAVEGSHEHSATLRELSAGLALLPADQREALFLLVMQGMSYEEIAERTGAAVGTAKSRVFRARRTLQAHLLGEARGDLGVTGAETKRPPARPTKTTEARAAMA